MARLVLRILNAPVLILLTLLAVAVQSSFFTSWPLMYLQPDAVLLVVIWCALRRNFTEGGIITLIVANVAELHSAAPQGYFMITYMGLYLMTRGSSRLFVIPNLSSLLIVTLFGTVVFKLGGLGLLNLLGTSGNQWRHTLMYLFPGAVVQSGIGVWVYRWLDQYDRLTYKTVHTEHGLEEFDDEFQKELWHS